MEFNARILDIQDEAEHVKTFYLERPSEFVFESGQWCNLDIGLPLKRPMSISSEPMAPALRFTIKLKGIFTQTLFTFKIGDSILLRGPFGKKIDEKNKMVFIAGGTGITPFMSFIRQIAKNNSPIEVILFNSNKTKKDLIFANELQSICSQHKNITVINTLTQEDWSGETGRINAKMITKYVQNPQEYEWHICGPKEMEVHIKELLSNLQVTKNKEGYQ